MAHFLFVLLHELCHCLLNVPFPKDAKEIYDYEFLVDVLSIAALREVVPTHARQCREAIRSLSYIAADEMKERLGPKMQREILRDPEAFLRKMVEPAQRLPNQEDQTAPVKKEV